MKEVVYIESLGDRIRLIMDNGKEEIVKFNPYFYVEDKNGKYEGIDGVKVSKILCKDVQDLINEREKYLKMGKKIYEADIPHIRRFMIDNYDEYRFKKDVDWAVIDLEVDDSEGSPTLDSQILCCSIVYKDGSEEWVEGGSNEKLLREVVNRILSRNIHIVFAWNGDLFDFEYFKKYVPNVDIMYIDAMRWYRKMTTKTKLALDFVAKDEGFGGKLFVRKKVTSMSKDEMKEYNLEDSRLVRKIINKVGIDKVIGILANETGVRYDEVESNMRVIDAMLLRRAKMKGIVLPSNREYEKKSYNAAIVIKPKMGVYEWVGVFDFNSLYPNIVLAYGIDYVDSKDLMIWIVKYFLNKRFEFKRKWFETGIDEYYWEQFAFKIMANAVYGVTANNRFRLYDVSKSAEITARARENLMRMVNIVEDIGYEVIYGDTDSVFVNVGSSDESDYRFIEKEINKRLYPLSVKWEKTYRKFIIGDKKKRYVGAIVYENGKKLSSPKIAFKGFEVVRSDWCDLAKEVQSRVVEMFLVEDKSLDEIKDYLKKVRTDMYLGKFDEKLVITKSVKKLDEYKASQPHVRALKHYIERTGDKNALWVSYVIVKGGKEYGLLNYDELKKINIDYKWYWDRQIKGAYKKILDIIEKKNQSKLERWYK